MNDKEEIVCYRFERTEETYQEALLMQREKHWKPASRRFSIGILSRRGLLIRNSVDCIAGCLMPDRREIIDFVRYAVDDVEPWTAILNFNIIQ